VRGAAEDCSPGRGACTSAQLLSIHDSEGKDFGFGIDASVTPRPVVVPSAAPRLRASA